MRSNPIKKLLFILPALVLMNCQPEKKQAFLLPVFGEKKTSDNDTIYHTITGFSLLNQHGDTVSDKTVKDKIYIANFFFVSCQSICPEMSNNLVEVQDTFAHDDSVLILSHSVNPLHDTVEVLQGYALTYGAKKNKWHLLTGNKKEIYDLARYNYLVNAIEEDGTPEGFLHSELFLLVDTKGRLRGMYDGTDKNQVHKMVEDIRLLKKEKEQ